MLVVRFALSAAATSATHTLSRNEVILFAPSFAWGCSCAWDCHYPCRVAGRCRVASAVVEGRRFLCGTTSTAFYPHVFRSSPWDMNLILGEALEKLSCGSDMISAVRSLVRHDQRSWRHLQTLVLAQPSRLPAMPQKRPHQKSRYGCDQCRKRRVKCDEKAPRCTNCNTRG